MALLGRSCIQISLMKSLEVGCKMCVCARMCVCVYMNVMQLKMCTHENMLKYPETHQGNCIVHACGVRACGFKSVCRACSCAAEFPAHTSYAAHTRMHARSARTKTMETRFHQRVSLKNANGQRSCAYSVRGALLFARTRCVPPSGVRGARHTRWYAFPFKHNTTTHDVCVYVCKRTTREVLCEVHDAHARLLCESVYLRMCECVCVSACIDGARARVISI